MGFPSRIRATKKALLFALALIAVGCAEPPGIPGRLRVELEACQDDVLELIRTDPKGAFSSFWDLIRAAVGEWAGIGYEQASTTPLGSCQDTMLEATIAYPIAAFFGFCVLVLMLIGEWTGMGYERANIFIFVLLQPALILLFLLLWLRERRKARDG